MNSEQQICPILLQMKARLRFLNPRDHMASKAKTHAKQADSHQKHSKSVFKECK